MICKNCGNSKISDEKFCTNCGTKFSDTVEQNVTEISNENSVYTQIEKQPENVEAKKKTNIAPFMVVGVILIIAVIIALLIMKFVAFTPKNLFFKGINEAYSNISETLSLDSNKENKYKDKIVSLESNTTFDLNADEDYLGSEVVYIFDLLNKIKLGLNETMDPKTSNFDLDLTLSNDEGNLSIEGNKRDNTIYLKLVDIFDKYISIPMDVTVTVNTMEKEDLEYLTKKIKDIFLNSLDESKFVQESVTLSLQNEDVNANKISYEIDAKEAEKILTYVTEEIQKDDKLLEILATSSNLTKKELSDLLDELVLEVDDTSTDVIELSVYTTGLFNEIVSYDISVKSEEMSIKIAFSDYKDVNEIRLSSNGMSIIHIQTKEIKKDEYETTITALTASAKINTSTSDTKSTMTITLDELSSGIDFDGKFEYTNNNDKGNLIMSLKLNIEDEEIFDLNTNTEYEISIDKTLKQINIHNAVDSEFLTEEDSQQILTNLQKNGFFNSIMNSIMGY